jgi:hypothetical protein
MVEKEKPGLHNQPRFFIDPIANAKSFFRNDTCSKNPNPPYPPFSKGGNLAKIL